MKNNKTIFVLTIILFSKDLFQLHCVYSKSYCGFPGSPANGQIDKNKDTTVYNTGSKVTFHCDEGYEIFGSRTLACQKSGNWNSSLPICRKNAALYQHTTQSSTMNNSNADYAVDNLIETCARTKKRIKDENYWEVKFSQEFEIVTISIFLEYDSNYKKKINLSLQLLQTENNYVNCADIEQHGLTPMPFAINCARASKTTGIGLKIVDKHGYQSQLILCDVKVYVEEKEKKCGQAEVKPFCSASYTTKYGEDYVQYAGHIVEGAATRRCINGSWIGEAPVCIDDGIIKQTTNHINEERGSTQSYKNISEVNRQDCTSEKTVITIGTVLGFIIIIVIVACILLYKAAVKRIKQKFETSRNTNNAIALSSLSFPNFSMSHSVQWNESASFYEEGTAHVYEEVERGTELCISKKLDTDTTCKNVDEWDEESYKSSEYYSKLNLGNFDGDKSSDNSKLTSHVYYEAA